MAIKHTNPTKPRWDRKDRVEVWAVAPYNFVPLPEKMVEAQPPLDHDSYQPEPVAYTGWIECELETCSPTYIRGMLTEKQFADFGQAGPDQLTEAQKEAMADFFGREKDVPLIPGSSLRGMIRQIVEIVGHGRMRYVSPTPTFTYRAVAASADDPLRDPYREVVGAFARNVRAGYLQKKNDEWWIRPASLPSSLNLAEKGAFLKVKERDIPAKTIPGLYRLNSPEYQPSWHHISFAVENRRGKRGPYTAITRIGSREEGYQHQGVLVCSGNMMETGNRTKRRNHALILEEDNRARSIQIDPQAVQDYRDGLTPFQNDALDAWGGNGWGCLKDGAPVFYVPEGNRVRYFGHSPNFRIPARLNLPGETRAANPRDFVPDHLRKNPKPDLADAIFGWVEEKEWVEEKDGRGRKIRKERVIGPPGQRAGRVFFSDAHFESAANGLWFKEEPITPHVLSGPKPTTFQHYLVQDGKAGQNGHHPDNKAALAHYGTPPDETQIRGYKLYWHRGTTPDIEASATELAHPTQLTRIKPLQAEVRFRFKVHFENLRPEELGVLWWSLALPGESDKQYRHKLGMGKPLGMGAVAITPRLFITNRQDRYETLFSGEQWQMGVETADSQPFVDKLNQYLLQQQGVGARLQNITELERIQMLLAMLEWREGTLDWLAKTRYMEIEHGPKKINEYKERPVLPDPLNVVGKSTPELKKPTRQQPASQPPSKPSQLSSPKSFQPGDSIRGTVYEIDPDSGDVYFEIEGISANRLMGHISAANLAGKQYQLGHITACIVINVGKHIVECKPKPKNR